MASKAVQKIEIETPAVQATTSESGSLISMLTQAARDPTVDVPKMREMYQMLLEMRADDKRTKFLAALVKLQAKLPAIERKGEAHNKKKYARFEDFIEGIKPINAEHGFSLTFRIDQTDTAIKVTGVLGHEAGHQETTMLSLPIDKSGNKNDVQALGSSISYGKRYVGMTLLGIATEDEDDDGKAAGAAPKETITEKQVEELKALVSQTKEPAATAMIILQRKKVADFAELKPAELAGVKTWLKDKFGVE